MKNISLSFLLILIALGFTQCSKDNITPEPPVIINVEDQNRVNFLVQVSDINGLAVDAATITINESGEQYQTDENGLFFLKNKTVKNYGIPITIEKTGYLDQIAILKGRTNSDNIVRLKLLQADQSTVVARGSKGSLSGGGTITLPNEIVTANGQAYNGDVVVESFYFNPDQADFLQLAPAELLATNAEGELRALGTYGMYAIELKDQSGNELQIASGAKATIEFPIANQQNSSIPSTIALWSLNETTGVWELEGNAERVGDKMVAEVSHFSFWNLDVEFAPVQICMTLLDANDNPLNHTEFLISSTNLNVAYSYGTTDANGSACALIPIDEEMAIRIVSGSDIVSSPVNIGPASTNTDLGNIVLPITAYHFEGKAIDCNGAAIANAIIRYVQGGSSTYLYSDGDGAFQFTSFSDQDITYNAFDLSGNLKSEEETVINDGSTNYNLGELSLCTAIQTGQVFTIESDIDSDMTWLEGNTYVLKGIISVINNATLNIEPGVVVKGLADDNGVDGSLVITKEATINAVGTASKPIIFTSFLDALAPGEIISPTLNGTDVALWGGVLILGEAPVSLPNNQTNSSFLPNDPRFEYGGTNAADQSGTIQYVSIRHAGSEVLPGEEIPGLVLAGVGSGTTINHVEIYATQDDGMAILGGSVDLNDVVVWNAQDDGYDVDKGWSGTLDNFIYIGGMDADGAIELDGGEGTSNPSFRLINGSCKGGDNNEYIEFRSNAQCQVETSYFFNFPEGAIVHLKDDEVARDWIDGFIDVVNLEFNTSHLSSGNTTINQIFVDGGLNNQDAFSSRLPDASLTTSRTVGADKTGFSNWSLADQTGALTEF